MFGTRREPISWWPKQAQSPERQSSALTSLKGQMSSPLAFFQVRPRTESTEETFDGICALAAALLRQAHRNVGPYTPETLYQGRPVELAAHHTKAIENQFELGTSWLLRESYEHILWSCSELREWQTTKAISETRPHMILVSREDFHFLASSPSRIKIFEEFIHFLSTNAIPLILISEHSLFALIKSDTHQSQETRPSYRSPEGRLRFRSSKQKSVVSQVESFEELLSTDIFDRMLDALEKGKRTVFQWFGNTPNRAQLSIGTEFRR